METTDKRNNSLETKDPRNQNLNRQNTVMNEKLYKNDEMRKANRLEDIKNYGYTINGYDPNKAIPDQERITNSEDDLDDLDDDFHAPGDLEDDSDDLNDEFDNPSDDVNDDFTNAEDDFEEELDDHTHTTGDILYDENADNLNDEIDNPSDSEELTESDNDLQELDPDDDDLEEDNDDDEDLEDDLEEGEIEEEDSGDRYPDNDPRKF